MLGFARRARSAWPLLTPLFTGRSSTEREQHVSVAEAERVRVIRQPAVGHAGRELEPEDAAVHAVTAAAGFEAPVEPFLQLITPEVLSVDGVRCYLGEVNGKAVTTGLGVTFGANVGIFNIATPPAHRHHGYGAAVTARAVADGFASGATWSWLQASPSGLAVYKRLGFRTVESWSCWVAPPAS